MTGERDERLFMQSKQIKIDLCGANMMMMIVTMCMAIRKKQKR
jgi:hypothetical protein